MKDNILQVINTAFVFAYRLSYPHGKCSQKRTGFLISKQECNILSRHIRICKVRFRQQFLCVVEMFLKTGVLFLKFSLKGTLAVAKLFRHIVNGTHTARQQFH